MKDLSFSIDHITNVLATRTRRIETRPALTPAAVLVLLFGDALSPTVLLTKRTETVEHHKGQISFPGGVRDDGDADAAATAMREAEEEIGLPVSLVNPLGILDDLAVPTGFIITPVVAYLPVLPVLRPSPAEVAEIIEIPLPFFADETNRRTVPMVRNGMMFDVHYFNYGLHEVWGATAHILKSFIDIIRSPSKP